MFEMLMKENEFTLHVEKKMFLMSVEIKDSKGRHETSEKEDNVEAKYVGDKKVLQIHSFIDNKKVHLKRMSSSKKSEFGSLIP